ncbi:uncharacterized protein K02A2.6-like [Trichonephila clavipes]|nr:uncharacterized protein K02A2.6-like [Trichonephila clavipes]
MAISDGSPTFDIGPNVSQHNRAEVEQLLSTYTPKKTKTVNIELYIALTDDEPIFHKPRRLPFAERDIVDAQVDEWVKKGIVEPCSSPYASQVVVVKKKDGKSRVCIDYRRLNRKLIKDNYPWVRSIALILTTNGVVILEMSITDYEQTLSYV